VLWVVRFDVAILMAVAVALVGIPIVWTAAATTDFLLQMAEEGRDRVPPDRVKRILDNIQISLQLLTAGLGAAAALLWFGAVYRSAYKAVAPAMRIYPRIIDLFVPLAVVALVAATTVVAIDLAMARGDGVNSGESKSDPKWLLFKFLFAIETAAILAVIFALILRWSVAASLALTVGAVIIAGAALWIAAITVDYLPTSLADEAVAAAALAFGGLACLFVPLWIARSRRNSRARRVFVALSIPMAVLAVAALEISFLIEVDHLARQGYIQGLQAYAISREYGPHISLILHSVVALLFTQWIYVRWARLCLRPE